MTAPATSVPTSIDFLTYMAAAQPLAELLRRVSQHSTLCHHYLERHIHDRSELQRDIEQALLTLNGDLDRIAQHAIDRGVIDTEGDALLPPGYTVVMPKLTHKRDGAL